MKFFQDIPKGNRLSHANLKETVLPQSKANIKAASNPPRLVALEKTCPPLFSSAWWLDAVAPGRWGEVCIEKGSRLQARLAYVVNRRPLVGDMLGIPPITPFLGPEFPNLEREGSRQIGEQHELMYELIDKLPSHARFLQNFHPDITNWLPFYWRGFSQHTRYTYQIQCLRNLDTVWSNFSSSTRRAIRKAEKLVTLDESGTPDDLYQLLQATYANQGRTAGYAPDVLRRAVDAALQRGQGRLLIAHDKAGKRHAGLFTVWNEEVTYYLVGGSDPSIRSSGAMSLLMWNAIQYAHTVSHCFDFEGSMQPGIERFVRGFGSVQVPYFQVLKETKLAAVVRKLYKLKRP